MRAALQHLKQYLLCGVSYVIPFVACGGILIATAIALAPMTPGVGPDFSHAPTLKLLLDIGVAAFTLVVPVLSGYIAFGMADRPALVPGFVGGFVANAVGAGFLGGIISGLLAGGAVLLIRRVKVPRMLRPVMPILVIPVLSSVTVGLLMFGLLGAPIRDLMAFLAHGLRALGSGNQVLLGLTLGAMIAFDMGGPVNKAAFFFGAAMIKEGNFTVMGACAAAICIPPLGLGLATLFAPGRWSTQEKEAGVAALTMGVMGITEGAIPFAVGDPVRVIPVIMGGSALGAAIAMLGGVADHAPHGGLIVLPVIDHRLWYLLAILVGVLAVALAINLLRACRPSPLPEQP
jgi:PTS system fructose-specific IIC component/fructose-specific PTS system IIC-like component